MSFEADLRSHLLADSAITDLVASRIYPVMRPQASALPALVYSLSREPQNSIDGFTSGLVQSDVVVNAIAANHYDAKVLARAVTDRMDESAATFTAVIGAEIDNYDADTRSFGVQLEYSLWFKT